MKKKTKKSRPTSKGPKPSEIKRAVLREWIGNWVTTPKNKTDKTAADLAVKAVRITKAGSLVSPVAIASIDVLGMTDLLQTKPLEEVARLVAEPFFDLDGPAYQFGSGPLTARQLIRRGFRAGPGIVPAMITDAIVLARRPTWEIGNTAIANADAVIELATYVSKVTKINSLYGISLRSAISFGDCIIGVAGRPVMLGLTAREAMIWEHYQEWAGGMLTPSAVEALREGAKEAKRNNGDDFVPHYPDCLVEYPVPLKEGSPALPSPSLALNWVTGFAQGVSLFYKSKVPSLPAPGESPEDVRRKISNTITFAKACKATDITEKGINSTVINWGF